MIVRFNFNCYLALMRIRRKKEEESTFIARIIAATTTSGKRRTTSNVVDNDTQAMQATKKHRIAVIQNWRGVKY